MEQEIGIEEARKRLGDLADAAHHHGIATTITRHGRPYARLVPVEPLMQLTSGTRVTVPTYSIPEDWTPAGEVVEVGDEVVVVELDSGQRQELPADEVTPA